MKNMFIAVCAMFAVSAGADQPAPVPAYEVPVSRLQGNVACSIGLADKSFDCTLHAAGKGTMTIKMMEVKNKNGDVVGFYGMDQVSENGTNYTMVVMAGQDQSVKGISMVTDKQSNKSAAFDATMVSTSASELQAVNIAPLNVDMSDSSAIKVSLGFNIYAKPQAAIMQSNNSQDVINLIIDRLQPYLLSLKK